MLSFYKNLPERKKGVVLIVLGLSLIGAGAFGGPFLKSKLLEGEAVFAPSAAERMNIDQDYLAMNEEELRGFFRKNRDKAELVNSACSLEKKEFNEIPVEVAQVCRLAARAMFFKPHVERTTTFSSAGGLK